ncbi:MAG TPA: hypothetical protein VLK36_07860 [Gaiellaceae bacterium]|nr:hypothetical protein [Gaiellaceae bacterium]
MKLRIIVLLLCGVAGAGASFAFAAGGKSHQDGPCRHAVVFGTVSAPQSLTVNVSRAWFRPKLEGQQLKVAVGSSGQTIRFSGAGCVGSDGTLTVTGAVLQVMRQGRDGGGTTTTGSTTTESTPTTTTSGGSL